MEKQIFDITPTLTAITKRQRVAAYARVSCDKDKMLHSLAAQIDYYRKYITRNPEWEFVGVYADEAKTGTKDDREQFQRLLYDCRGACGYGDYKVNFPLGEKHGHAACYGARTERARHQYLF